MRLKLGVARNEDVSYSLNYKNNNLYGKNENLTCLLQTKQNSPSQARKPAMPRASPQRALGTGLPCGHRTPSCWATPRGQTSTQGLLCKVLSPRGADQSPLLSHGPPFWKSPSTRCIKAGEQSQPPFFFFNFYLMLESS